MYGYVTDGKLHMLQQHLYCLEASGNRGHPAILHEVFDAALSHLREDSGQDGLNDRVDQVLVTVLVGEEIQQVGLDGLQEVQLLQVDIGLVLLVCVMGSGTIARSTGKSR